MFRPARCRRSLLRFLTAAVAVIACPLPGRADTVYFVSKDRGALYELNTAGGGITQLTGTNTFPDATALAIGPDGKLYIGDTTNGGSIRRYTVGGGVETVVTLSGANPAFAGGPVSPTAIAFTPGGAMLVGRNPVSAFSGYPSGQVLAVSGWAGNSPNVQDYTSGTSLAYQTGLTVSPDGTLFASNTVYNIFASPPALIGDVVKFDGTGAFQAVVASGSAGVPGPAGLAVSGTMLFSASSMDGNIYKTDLADLNPTTNTTLFASSGISNIGPLAMLADGSLLAGYVGGEQGQGNIFMFSTSGSLTSTFGGAEYGAIGGIAAVPEPTGLLLAVAGGAVWGLSRLCRRRRA
jgi:hypothetical protein